MSKPEDQQTNDAGDLSKEKLHSIMEAASALKALTESDGSAPSSPRAESRTPPSPETSENAKDVDANSTKGKRYIPEHKKPDAALTFPEKLMKMMKLAEEHKANKEYCIGWLPDGKSFVIRNPDAFTRQVLPKFFKATKFSSFTRKLYRWGFRQVNRGIGPDDPIIFANEYFQRDDAELMVKMRSVTAAGTRKAKNVHALETARATYLYAEAAAVSGRKRPALEQLHAENEERRRILLDRLLQEKAALGSALAESEAALAGVSSLHPRLNLTSALRTAPAPALSLGVPGLLPKRVSMLGSDLRSNSILGSGLRSSSLLPAGTGNLMSPSAASRLNLYNASVSQPLAQPSSSTEIVNAAINALRFAS